jgi:hypothetical protein
MNKRVADSKRQSEKPCAYTLELTGRVTTTSFL